MRILLTGGGTGGHLFPLVAIVQQLKKIETTRHLEPLEFLFIGPDSFGQDVFKKYNIPAKNILAGKLRRYPSLMLFLDALGLIVGLIQSLYLIFNFMPDAIFSKGGYGSLPVIIAGWIYRIPIIIHESDTIPGLTNRFSERLAALIAVSFPKSLNYFPASKTIVTGQPIREEIITGSKEKSAATLGLTLTRPVLLILGGSQGAQPINEIFLAVLPKLLEKSEIIHQCGKINYEETKERTNQMVGDNKNYHLLAFLNEEELKDALAAADLIVSRAGAGTLFEIAACGKPSILIPLPDSASGHQRENAYAMASAGGTIVLEQANLTPNFFQNRILQLLENPALLKQIGDCAKNLHQPEAAQKIAEEIIKLGSR